MKKFIPVITMAIYGTLALSWCCTSGGFLFSLLTIILVVDVKCVFLVRSFNVLHVYSYLIPFALRDHYF